MIVICQSYFNITNQKLFVMKKDTIFSKILVVFFFDNSSVTAKTIYTGIKCMFLTAVIVIQYGDDPKGI